MKEQVHTERALIRTIAGSSRRLDEDLNLSPLQAIDRLQKADAKFKAHWWKPPFLVLEDGYTLPAPMPVPRMLAHIAEHGQAVGIVGIALLSTKRWTVFKQMFRKDEKSRKTVEASATLAASIFKESLRSPYSGNVYTNGKQISIFYSWEVGTPEPGWELAGTFDLVPFGDKFELKTQKSPKHIKVMAAASKRFGPKMEEIAKLLSSTKEDQH